jgi:N-acetylneuraminate synthase
MSTLDEIDTAIKILESGGNDVALLHCTSTYPCPLNEINLRMIPTLRERYSVPVGYSGHETGLVPTWAAVALGSTIVERHITLDRSMWGSDQAASVEPGGLMRMVKGIREIEASIGNGQKRVYESEKPIRDKLRF